MVTTPAIGWWRLLRIVLRPMMVNCGDDGAAGGDKTTLGGRQG